MLLLSLLASSTQLQAQHDCDEIPRDQTTVEDAAFRVVTLNMAHGRKDGRNQMFLKNEVIRDNLADVAQGIQESQAHVIGLQEADAPSRWSGNFDHVRLLSEESGYACFFHGIHASNRYYDFGTALISSHPFHGAFSHSFEPSWPTTNKGFVLAAVRWNPGGTLNEPIDIKVGSVHLDFSRRSVRRAQIDEMVGVLEKIDGPMILMGDFNTDWQTEDSSLRYLADQLGLHVFEPHADGLSTYGDKGARLDWILISPELEFQQYAVVPRVMSDHYAVAADIILANGNAEAEIDGGKAEPREINP